MGVRKSPEETRARRGEVKGFIETIGPFSVPIKVLAEKYNVTVKVIYNDIKFWLKKIDLKGIEIQGRKLIQHAIKNLSVVEELRAKGAPIERIRAVQVSCQAVDEVVKLLEGFGYKEKIAEKFEHSGKIFNVNITEVKNEASGSETGDEQTSKPGVDNLKR